MFITFRKLALILVFGMLSSNSFSQVSLEGSTGTQPEEEDVERINITGSRILVKNNIDILPLTIFTGEELADRGYVSLADLVRELIISTNSIFDPYLNPMGIAAFDFRGLGVESTLTLLNGHRVAPVGLSDKSIDVSVIPVSIIERVEILKDGASALYGADAVAGETT